MTRPSKSGSGRITEAPVYDPEFDELPTLRLRNPVKFWGIMIAAAAMVLVSMGGLIAAIFAG